MTIPENEEWVLDRVFISEGNAYSIQISKTSFLNNYTSKDTLAVPYYMAEMELLSNKEMVQFQFHFKK